MHSYDLEEKHPWMRTNKKCSWKKVQCEIKQNKRKKIQCHKKNVISGTDFSELGVKTLMSHTAKEMVCL